jgi:hypothetical protein
MIIKVHEAAAAAAGKTGDIQLVQHGQQWSLHFLYTTM